MTPTITAAQRDALVKSIQERNRLVAEACEAVIAGLDAAAPESR